MQQWHCGHLITMSEAVVVNRGFQLLNTLHLNHQIRCVTQQSSDAVAVHYTVGSQYATTLCPFKPHEAQSKYSVSEAISQFIYIRKYRLYVAFCPDLTLRVFTEQFELIQIVHITATILSLTFNDATSELYSGGVGCIDTWQLRHQLHKPLVPGKPFSCSVKQQQWVVSLDFDVCSEKLVAACQDYIYIIDVQTHNQIDSFSNGHKASITSAILFPQLDYLISAAKDGSIKVWNNILHNEIHTFTGHTKAVTALKAHPLAPCVISCSVDGTVRIWHLESMAEYYRLDCGEEMLGMSSDFPFGTRMVSFSHQNAKLWTLHQLEALFAMVNSQVVSMGRAEGRGRAQPARIIAVAEDGGVRLLSPVTGDVITILFPMFSTQILQDVLYSLGDGLLFVLLRTGEVLVFSTHTNPCSARELWVPSSKDMINCITLCTLTQHDGSLSSLVFGGQDCGHISLLYSNGLSMPHPCPAHAGHVVQLASLANPPSTTIPALVSYGSDNKLNIWAMEIEENTVCLKLQTSIILDTCPSHMALLDSTLCLALPVNKLIYLNIPHGDNNKSTIHSLSDIPTLTHQCEDDHTDTITSLSCCPFLKAFATSSKDGRVKIWSSSNQLISEIHFGATLASVCFANPQGDLLVGFQKHICIVQAEDYLPALYIEKSKCRDRIEDPILFDPTLKFWYDPDRVPSLPAQQYHRKKVLTQTNLQNSVPSYACLEGEEIHTHPSSHYKDIIEAAGSFSAGLQSSCSQVVDSCLAKQLSQEYFASLKQQNGKVVVQQASQEITLSSSDDSTGVGTLRENSSLTSSHHLATIAELPEKQPASLHYINRSSCPLYEVCEASTTSLLPAAEVMPLQSVSTKFPIAPDGLIPNSVLRAQLEYVAPEVVIPVPKPKPKQLPATPPSPQAATEDKKPSIPVVTKSHMKQHKEEEDGEVFTCVLELLDPPVKRTPVHSPQQPQTPTLKRPTPSPSHLEDSLQEETVLPSTSITPPGIAGDQVSVQKEVKPKMVTRFDPPLEEPKQTQPRRNSFQTERRFSHLALTTPQRDRRLSLTSEGPGRGHSTSSCITGTPSVERSQSNTTPPQQRRRSSTTHVSDVNRTGLLLLEIASRPWFPRKPTVPSLKAIFDILVLLLKTSQKPVFAEVCTALMELKQASMLTSEQQLVVLQQLLARLKNDMTLKVTILKTLELLGLGGRDVVLVILPLLTDSESDVQRAAFRALEAITGIVNRSQLHHLLIEMGLLQNVVADEDHILRALAAHIQNDHVKLPSKNQDHAKPSNKHGDRRNRKHSDHVEGKHNKECSDHRHSDHVEGKHNKECSDHKKKEYSDHMAGKHSDSRHHVKLPPLQQQGRTQTQSIKMAAMLQNLAAPSMKPQQHTQCSVRQQVAQEGFPWSLGLKDPYNPQLLTTSNYNKTDRLLPTKPTPDANNKLCHLIAHHPTTFAQTKPALRMMLGAYGGDSRHRAVVCREDYAWSEVYPVIRAAKSHKQTSSRRNNQAPPLPRLQLSPEGAQEKRHTQTRDVVVKLPQLAVFKTLL